MLTSQAAKSLIGWNTVSLRIVTARFHTKWESHLYSAGPGVLLGAFIHFLLYRNGLKHAPSIQACNHPSLRTVA